MFDIWCISTCYRYRKWLRFRDESNVFSWASISRLCPRQKVFLLFESTSLPNWVRSELSWSLLEVLQSNAMVIRWQFSAINFHFLSPTRFLSKFNFFNSVLTNCFFKKLIFSVHKCQNWQFKSFSIGICWVWKCQTCHYQWIIVFFEHLNWKM